MVSRHILEILKKKTKIDVHVAERSMIIHKLN